MLSFEEYEKVTTYEFDILDEGFFKKVVKGAEAAKLKMLIFDTHPLNYRYVVQDVGEKWIRQKLGITSRSEIDAILKPYLVDYEDYDWDKEADDEFVSNMIHLSKVIQKKQLEKQLDDIGV